MKITSIIAIFALFWSMSFFFVLPFRLRHGGADEAPVPGQAESAPPAFSFARTCGWTTVVALVLFAAFYANWAFGWVGADVMDFLWERQGR